MLAQFRVLDRNRVIVRAVIFVLVVKPVRDAVTPVHGVETPVLHEVVLVQNPRVVPDRRETNGRVENPVSELLSGDDTFHGLRRAGTR